MILIPYIFFCSAPGSIPHAADQREPSTKTLRSPLLLLLFFSLHPKSGEFWIHRVLSSGTLCLDSRAKKIKNIKYFISRIGHLTHNLSILQSHACVPAPRLPSNSTHTYPLYSMGRVIIFLINNLLNLLACKCVAEWALPHTQHVFHHRI